MDFDNSSDGAALPEADRPAIVAVSRCRDLDGRIGSRAERTVRVTLPAEGKPYNRRSFVDLIDTIVGVGVIEAIGPSNQSHIWSITFETAAAKQ